jgi:succinyl-CoA synthetase beta subunit
VQILLEHQAKSLLADCGLSVPRGVLLGRGDDTAAVRELVGPPPWMLKAQVLGHRRASWGGVVRVDSNDELLTKRAEMFARPGRVFDQVLVEEYVTVSAEWFCAVMLDPARAALRLMLSAEGGGAADAALAAGRFAALEFDPVASPASSRIVSELGVSNTSVAEAAAALCRFAVQRDCVLIEVNPLGVDARGRVLVLDAHLTADVAAEYRQPSLHAFIEEIARLDPDVAWRRRWDGDFFILDEGGEVALINTGAGAGLFLVDELRRRGTRPLNFSDVRMAGIIRQPERMTAVVDRIVASPSARTVLVNIHAGIGDPLETVHLVLAAAQRLRSAGCTMVIRLAGRNAERAAATLTADGFTVRTSLRDALDEVTAVASAARA